MSNLKTISSLQAISTGQLNQQQQKLNALSNQKDNIKTSKDIDKAASGFEALLLQEMMQSMWNTVEFTDMLGEKSNEADIYRDMLNQAIADSTASGRGIGVKEMMQKELLKTVKASK